MSEEKTPFTVEIIEGILASIAVLLYLRRLALPFIIIILLWLVIFRKRIATIAGAILIALVTSPLLAERAIEYVFMVALIGLGIVVEFTFQVGLPILRGQSIGYSSVLETTFFYVVGVVISYVIQMSFCGVSVNGSGPLNLLRIQSQILDCQFEGNNLALICIRWLFTSAVFWGSMIVALRRIDFDPRDFGRLPRALFRALLGAGVAIIIAAMINTIKIYLADQYNYSPLFLEVYSYMYFAISIIMASIGASYTTRRL